MKFLLALLLVLSFFFYLTATPSPPKKEGNPLVCLHYYGDIDKMKMLLKCKGLLKVDGNENPFFITYQQHMVTGTSSAMTILTLTEQNGNFVSFIDKHRKIGAFPNLKDEDLEQEFRFANEKNPVDIVVYVCSRCEGETIKAAGTQKDTGLYFKYLNAISDQATHLNVDVEDFFSSDKKTPSGKTTP